MHTMNTQKGNTAAIAGIVVALAVIGFGVWYYMQQQPGAAMAPQVSAAPPVSDNSDLSSSDDPKAIAKDTDDAYMAKLQADINADMKATQSF